MTTSVALHEAAHAVVAEQVGIRVEYVEIGRRVVDAGEGAIAANGFVVFGTRCSSDFEVAMTYAAGPVAEELVTGFLRRDRTPGSDFVEVDWFTLGDPDVEQFVIEAARAAIASDWQSIERVAEALAARGTLSGDDVRCLVGEAPANLLTWSAVRSADQCAPVRDPQVRAPAQETPGKPTFRRASRCALRTSEKQPLTSEEQGCRAPVAKNSPEDP